MIMFDLKKGRKACKPSERCTFIKEMRKKIEAPSFFPFDLSRLWSLPIKVCGYLMRNLKSMGLPLRSSNIKLTLNLFLCDVRLLWWRFIVLSPTHDAGKVNPSPFGRAWASRHVTTPSVGAQPCCQPPLRLWPWPPEWPETLWCRRFNLDLLS